MFSVTQEYSRLLSCCVTEVWVGEQECVTVLMSYILSFRMQCSYIFPAVLQGCNKGTKSIILSQCVKVLLYYCAV